MPKFTVTLIQEYEYTVEAEDDMEALDLAEDQHYNARIQASCGANTWYDDYRIKYHDHEEEED